jgi:hypothetical protein
MELMKKFDGREEREMKCIRHSWRLVEFDVNRGNAEGNNES